SRATSISLTLKPSSRRALATARPEVSETSRSDDHPPIRTATCGLAMAAILRPADAPDLPAQLDAALCLHLLAHGFAQRLEIGGGCIAAVDQEIAVLLGYLRIAHHEAAAARRIDQLPGLVAVRIGEGGAAGAGADRLAAFAGCLDRVHPRLDRRRVAGLSLQPRPEEDPGFRHAAMAIAELHLDRRQAMQIALFVQRLGPDQNILEFGAVSTGIHAQAAAEGARNAEQEFQPGNAVHLRGLRHVDIQWTGARYHLVALGLDLDE